MHPTYTPPRLTPPVTPTRGEVAIGRTNLLALADHTAQGRNNFLVGYLASTLHGIAEHVIEPTAREQITRAFALIEADRELADEEIAAFPPGPDTPALELTKVPHEGIPCGRYAR